jgi:hypothetical protein
MEQQTQKELVYRRYADGTYAVGEVVGDGSVLFRAGNFNLTMEEYAAKLAQLQRQVGQ